MPALVSVRIVTAADEAFADKLSALIFSLRAQQNSAALPVTVLDLGLSAATKSLLGPLNCHFVEPGWDLDFASRAAAPTTFRAMTARPFLPRYCADAETIIWIDADIWLQDDVCMTALLQGVAAQGFIIAPEMSQCYPLAFLRHQAGNLLGLYEKAVVHFLGEKDGAVLNRLPIFNSGLFAMRATHPLWQTWQSTLAQLLTRGWHHWVEQIALGVSLYKMIYRDKRLPQLLPARCNWNALMAKPFWSAERRVLVEPAPPYEPISALHLTGDFKHGKVASVKVLEGGRIETALTYSAIQALKAKTASPV